MIIDVKARLRAIRDSREVTDEIGDHVLAYLDQAGVLTPEISDGIRGAWRTPRLSKCQAR